MIDRLLENPVLAGLGVLVAMVLGGFLWSSTRHRKQEDIFSEEPTLASQLAASRYEEPPSRPHVEVSDTSMLSELATSEMSPLHGEDASDPSVKELQRRSGTPRLVHPRWPSPSA